MDIKLLVLGSVFLLVLFIGIIFLVVYIGGQTKKNYKDIHILMENFRILNEAYARDIKSIMENQIEIIKKLKL